MSAPAWATRLVADVWAAEGNGTPVPTLVWWRSRGTIYSSGRTSLRRVHVTAGVPFNPGATSQVLGGRPVGQVARWDQRVVLLHELGHALVQAAGHRGEGHSERYWHTAWALYIRWRGPVPLAFILRREIGYRAGALHVAASLGIPGARAAVAHARKQKEGTMPTTTRRRAPRGAQAEGTKQCRGIPKIGHAPHEAPLADFNKAAGQPDGYDYVCRASWHAYVADLRERKAAQAAGATEAAENGPTPAPADEPASKVRRRRIRNVEAEDAATSKVAELLTMPTGESPAVTARRARFEARLNKVGVGSDAGQAMLARHAKGETA